MTTSPESEKSSSPSVVEGPSGEPCPSCRRPLPVRAKQAGEVAAHWECSACHSPLTGVLLKDMAPRMAESIRINQIHFDTSSVPPLPESLRELVKEFVASRQSNHPPDERRAHARVPLQLDVTVLRLDEHWTPQGKPIVGMAVDLTPNGLGMVTSAPVEAEHVAVQIRHPAGLVQILGQIVWVKEIGPSFHNAGVQFLLRFGRSQAGS